MAKRFTSSVAIVPVPDVREIALSMTLFSTPDDRDALREALGARGISPLRSSGPSGPGARRFCLVIGYGPDVRMSDAIVLLRQIVRESGLRLASSVGADDD